MRLFPQDPIHAGNCSECGPDEAYRSDGSSRHSLIHVLQFRIGEVRLCTKHLEKLRALLGPTQESP